MARRFMIGIFDSEMSLVKAATSIRESAMQIYDAYTPYPIHALDRLMGLKRSWLPIVCFLAASTGCLSALALQIWTSAISWPVNVGGKPFNSLPAFIPITFEVTVLVGGLVTTAAFLFRSKLFPGKQAKAKIINRRVNDDRFVLVLEEKGPAFDEHRAESLMKAAGALVVEFETL